MLLTHYIRDGDRLFGGSVTLVLPRPVYLQLNLAAERLLADLGVKEAPMSMTPTSTPAPASLRDLGWGNSWRQTPAIVAECQARRDAGEKHDLHSEDRSRGRGTENVYLCRTCGYVYRVDSGD